MVVIEYIPKNDFQKALVLGDVAREMQDAAIEYGTIQGMAYILSIKE